MCSVSGHTTILNFLETVMRRNTLRWVKKSNKNNYKADFIHLYSANKTLPVQVINSKGYDAT